MQRKKIVFPLVFCFVLSLLPVSFVTGVTPQQVPFNSKEAALESKFAAVKLELGGVPLAGFKLTEEDLEIEDDTLSYPGEFTLARAMSEQELETARKQFATIINRAHGIESYDIELDDDSLDVTFEQSRNIITVHDGVYGVRKYVPYVSVTVSLTTHQKDKDEKTEKESEEARPDSVASVGYSELEYNIDITLERKVIRLQVNSRDARINGVAHRLDVAPFIEGGRTLVPLRFLVEELDAVISWEPKEKKVTLTRGNVIIEMVLGEDKARISQQGVAPRTITLDVPAGVVRGRTVVPLRFVIENLEDVIIRWNQNDRSIIVRD